MAMLHVLRHESTLLAPFYSRLHRRYHHWYLQKKMSPFGSSQIRQWVGDLTVSWFLFTCLFVAACVMIHHVVTDYQSSLRVIPGPVLARYTRFYRAWKIAQGDAPVFYRRLHEKYGPIVRTGPRTVNISDPNAVQIIYGINSKFFKVCSSFSIALISGNKTDGLSRLTFMMCSAHFSITQSWLVCFRLAIRLTTRL
jgi:hypothetical protein